MKIKIQELLDVQVSMKGNDQMLSFESPYVVSLKVRCTYTDLDRQEKDHITFIVLRYDTEPTVKQIKDAVISEILRSLKSKLEQERKSKLPKLIREGLLELEGMEL